jgi:hypothetical protein
MAPQIISPMIFKSRDAAFENHKAASHSVKEKREVETQLSVSERRDTGVAKDFAAELLTELLVDAESGQVLESFRVGEMPGSIPISFAVRRKVKQGGRR